MTNPTEVQYKVNDKVVVIQFSPDAYSQFTEALENGDLFDFSQVEENDIKVLTDFQVTGPGEMV